MQLLKINRQRFEVVHKEISAGSEPALRFYILVAISTLIASFGLIANSTAVVIGAMLVAPLMTPIFGISLALVRGETSLLGHAARAEFVGVTAAVAMGFILGSVLGDFDPTHEMLSRTRPNLFDLLVAILAGFAGAFALVDEKISPALPGVAIATAIVPPLANSGLCFAMGEIRGGLGSFLLFFANFLSILIIASATFVLSGMAKNYGAKVTHIDIARRFGLPIVAFILIAIFLSNSLLNIYQERYLAKSIRTTLISELSRMPATALAQVHHYQDSDKVNIIATIHSPSYLTPSKVAHIQEEISNKIGEPAELIMHCILSNNISASGSMNNVFTPRLDGTFTMSSDNAVLNMIGKAEQIIREHLSNDPSLMLIRIEPLSLDHRKVLLAHLLGIRRLSLEEIKELEARIRTATGENGLELSVTSIKKELYNADGAIRYGWILGKQDTPEIRERIKAISSDVTSSFKGDEVFELVSVNSTRLDDAFHFLLEIVGPEVYPRNKVELLQTQLSEKYAEPVNLYAWSRVEVVHAPEGPLSMEELRQSFSGRQKENLPDELSIFIEATGR